MKQIFFIYIFTITKQINKNKEPPPNMNFQDSADIQQLAAMDTPLHIGVTPRYIRKQQQQQQQQTPATTSTCNTPAISLKTPKTPKVRCCLLFIVGFMFFCCLRFLKISFNCHFFFRYNIFLRIFVGFSMFLLYNCHLQCICNVCVVF